MATENKSQMELNFIELETAIEIKVFIVVKEFKQKHNRKEKANVFVDEEVADSEEKLDSSTQFSQRQEEKSIDLQERFERYSKVLRVAGLNSAKYEINLN